MTVKDAHWFLESLEQFHKSELTAAERQELERSELRAKAKHRNAVLFQDDLHFLFRMQHNLEFDEEGFDNSAHITDRRVYLLHQASKVVMDCYERSRANAPPKSCIWSALMYRVAYHLQRSGIADVKIEEHVQGVRHKESTLFVQGYHISRSNFTKLVRQRLGKGVPNKSRTGGVQPLPLTRLPGQPSQQMRARRDQTLEEQEERSRQLHLADHFDFGPPGFATGATSSSSSSVSSALGSPLLASMHTQQLYSSQHPEIRPLEGMEGASAMPSPTGFSPHGMDEHNIRQHFRMLQEQERQRILQLYHQQQQQQQQQRLEQQSAASAGLRVLSPDYPSSSSSLPLHSNAYTQRPASARKRQRRRTTPPDVSASRVSAGGSGGISSSSSSSSSSRRHSDGSVDASRKSAPLSLSMATSPSHALKRNMSGTSPASSFGLMSPTGLSDFDPPASDPDQDLDDSN